MGLPNTPYPALIGQRLAAVRVFEPWQASLPPTDALEAALLFGGVAFVFERQALILTSPLRYRSKPVGTYYGLPDGRSVSLGFRVTLCDADELNAFLPIAASLPHWLGWQALSLPAIGDALKSLQVVASYSAADGWDIELSFQAGLRYCLRYRAELDGSIEVAQQVSERGYSSRAVSITGGHSSVTSTPIDTPNAKAILAILRMEILRSPRSQEET